MIQWLIYLLIISLFSVNLLFFRYGIGFRQLSWLPEFLSIIIIFLIPFKTAVDKKVKIPIKYSLLIFLYLSHLFIGFLMNEVTGWVMLAGLRVYIIKFLPFFLLPLIFPLSEDNFKKIVRILFVIAMIQLPVVVYQRFFEFALKVSGDKMGGTLGAQTSGVLSVFLVVIMSFLIAFYLKDVISFRFFLLSFAAALIPTTLNETKITFFLLPVTLIFPAIFLREKAQSIIRIALAAVLLATSFFALKVVYDYFQSPRWGYGIVTFFTMPGRVEQYNRARYEPILDAIDNAQKDMRFFMFGRGAGNVSEGFTRRLTGKYAYEGELYRVRSSGIVTMIWEIGYFGIFLLFLFPFFVFWDAVRLCRQEGFFGAFALGMLSWCAFFTVAFFYTFPLVQDTLVYPFAFAAGYIVYRTREEEAIREEPAYITAGYRI